jgi:hypothetical protein
MTSRSWCLIILFTSSLPNVACGGDSGGAASSSAGGSPAAAGSGGMASGDCREYMTEGALEGPMPGGTIQTATATAAFDPSTSTYSGTMVAQGVSITDVRTYASSADFIDEVKVVGRDLCQREVYSGAYVASDVYVYDAQRRLIAIQVQEPVDGGQGAYGWTYTAWDAQGRPTAGSLDAPQAACTGMPVSITYDDQARKKTTSIDEAAGQGTGCATQVITSWKVYDSQGNVVEETHPSQATSTRTTVTKTARVCK